MTSAAPRESLLAGLSTLLWRERQLLELLLFKLVEEQMVLSSGQPRWLGRATREVELVLERVQVAELGREVELAALTRQLGLGDQVNLRTLIEVVEEPWPEILTKHREAFLDITREITSTAEHNRAIIGRAQAATRATLAWLAGEASQPDAYTATGAAAGGPRSSTLLNWAI